MWWLVAYSHQAIVSLITNHCKRTSINNESDTSNNILKMLLKLSFAALTVLNLSLLVCININQLSTKKQGMTF